MVELLVVGAEGSGKSMLIRRFKEFCNDCNDLTEGAITNDNKNKVKKVYYKHRYIIARRLFKFSKQLLHEVDLCYNFL